MRVEFCRSSRHLEWIGSHCRQKISHPWRDVVLLRVVMEAEVNEGRRAFDGAKMMQLTRLQVQWWSEICFAAEQDGDTSPCLDILRDKRGRREGESKMGKRSLSFAKLGAASPS